MPKLSRRELIRTGLAGAAMLVLADCARSTTSTRSAFDDPTYDYRALSGADRDLIAAVATVMLTGALPAEPGANRAALVQAVRGVDIAVSGLVPGVQGELRQLFGLLEFPATRALAAGVWSSWSDADAGAVANFLQRWRFSGVTLFRSGYQALHQLVMSGWYGGNAAWPRIGYPGPPVVA